jgi:hypothetical protein
MVKHLDKRFEKDGSGYRFDKKEKEILMFAALHLGIVGLQCGIMNRQNS